MTAAILQLRLDAQALRLQRNGHGVELAIGLDAVRARMPHFPPGEASVEAAIAAVEDALMPAIPALRALGGEWLGSDDPDVHRIVIEAVGDTTARADLAAVERVFNRFADVIAGLPASHASLDPSPRHAAVLVVVRELLHHVGLKGLAGRMSEDPTPGADR